ncbi:MAG: hypothetical protein HYR60_18240 [Acidobacteria bacterium]|nr:hypothetical protein [Acidobacteriota bacterium]
MSITVHPELEAKLRARAEADGITVDSYLERLMQDEDAEIAHTEALLQEAADSGEYVELNEEEWERMEREAVAEAEGKSKRRA